MPTYSQPQLAPRVVVCGMTLTLMIFVTTPMLSPHQTLWNVVVKSSALKTLVALTTCECWYRFPLVQYCDDAVSNEPIAYDTGMPGDVSYPASLPLVASDR